MKYQLDINQYLEIYPKHLKWINECPICHTKGYKPDMPLHIGGEYSIAGHQLRQYLKPLQVYEFGFCMDCAGIFNR